MTQARLFVQKYLEQIRKDVETVDSALRWVSLLTACCIASPCLILFAFVTFPYVSKWGYHLWGMACTLSFMAAIAGSFIWMIQQKYRHGIRAWFILLLALSEAAFACFCYVYGWFYWAFERGYFMD
jgi:hypothetical protein